MRGDATVDLSHEKLLELAQFSLTRIDGAWFMALARELGVETAWKMDIEAWKQFSYVFGKKIRKEMIPDPVWPESFLDAMEIMSKMLSIKGREVNVDGDMITVRVTDCEVQKAIAKAGIADCGIVTVYTYKGVAQALFGKQMEISVEHTKNLNRGDEYCEVVISK
jgi:predicted hydrocarbon binding protein